MPMAMAMQTKVVTIMIISMTTGTPMSTTANTIMATIMGMPANPANHAIVIMRMITQPLTITGLIMLTPSTLIRTSRPPRA